MKSGLRLNRLFRYVWLAIRPLVKSGPALPEVADSIGRSRLSDRTYNARIRAASEGDLLAQRAIIEEIAVAADAMEDPFLALYETTIWARIAASHGIDIDRQRLAACLCYFAKKCGDYGLSQLAEMYAAEAVAVLDELADEGSEVGADCVNQLASALSPHVLEMAKLIREEA